MRVRMADLRHAMGAVLTLSMFTMLANMIKHDHFSNVQVNLSAVEYNILEIKRQKGSAINFTRNENNGLLRSEKAQDNLKPCWRIPPSNTEIRQQFKGYIAFSLTNGPEYHMAQVANAVVVAKYLGANLLLPYIRGRKLEKRRNFSEIYDYHRFVNSLKGIVEVEVHRGQPPGTYVGKTLQVRVPITVSEAYIETHIKPVLHMKGSLRIWTYFPSRDMKNEAKGILDPVACLAMFDTLRPQPGIQRIVDGIMGRLKEAIEGHNGKIIAIDLREGALLGDGKGNRCDVKEVGEFLRKTGFGAESAIYVTHSRWNRNLDPLKDLFPRTYTKDLLVSKKHVQDPEVEKAIDFIMCAESNMFVPITENQFFTSVVGARIAYSRQMQNIGSSKISGHSASEASDYYISPYVSKKAKNPAYSCRC